MNEDFTVKATEKDYIHAVRFGSLSDQIVIVTVQGKEIFCSDDPHGKVLFMHSDNPSTAFEYTGTSIQGIKQVVPVEAMEPHQAQVYKVAAIVAKQEFEAHTRELWERVPIQKVFDYIDKIGDYADWYSGVAEMGYDDKPMICANWNHPKMKRLGDWIEKFYQDNIEVDWSDEWMACSDCGKAVRSSADSYGWEASWVWASDCDVVCHECAKETMPDVIDYYMNCLVLDKRGKALPSWMSPYVEHAGFKCLESEDAYCTRFESGFHPGQNDTPEGCLKLAKEILPYKFDYVFVITGVGQFDIHWAMFVRKVEDEDD
jgi:hypothetical protein